MGKGAFGNAVLYRRKDDQIGDCCGNNKQGSCGGYVFGSNLETLRFPDPIITTWTRGKKEMVVFYVGANHWGGYSYRLCKMPLNGRIYLTEECFEQTPLQFHGNKVVESSPSLSILALLYGFKELELFVLITIFIRD